MLGRLRGRTRCGGWAAEGGEFRAEPTDVVLVLLTDLCVRGLEIVEGLSKDAEFVHLEADCGVEVEMEMKRLSEMKNGK